MLGVLSPCWAPPPYYSRTPIQVTTSSAGRAGGHGDTAKANQHGIRVVGHDLGEIRVVVARTEDLVELLICLGNDAARPPSRLPVLAAQLDHPVFVDLGSDGDRVVRM